MSYIFLALERVLPITIELTVTYLVQSTLLIGAVWLVNSLCAKTRKKDYVTGVHPTIADPVWKLAAVMGLITAPISVFAGWSRPSFELSFGKSAISVAQPVVETSNNQTQIVLDEYRKNDSIEIKSLAPMIAESEVIELPVKVNESEINSRQSRDPFTKSSSAETHLIDTANEPLADLHAIAPTDVVADSRSSPQAHSDSLSRPLYWLG